MKTYKGVDAQIRDAMERGDFDNLPGKGKPLDLSEWEKTPEHLRMSYSVLKNAGYTPAEVTMKKEMVGLREMIQREKDPKKREKLMSKLRSQEITDAIRMERIRRKR